MKNLFHRIRPFLISLLLILLVFSCLFAQKDSGYFQQKVNTVLHVTLNDMEHSLLGTVFIEYINHSPKTLDTIYFHLWANAYQDKNSAFSRQKIDHGDATFYFANDELMGGYDSLSFRVNGRKAQWEFDKLNRDIAWVQLEEHLNPGDTVNISTPFYIKLPRNFSRMGHEDQSYQITQWFPKPAVFDRDGWHTMPYLDMGEFYSEFGDYDVTITLPENYFVAATGELTSLRELQRIENRVVFTQKFLDTVGYRPDLIFPSSSPNPKSIRYIAKNVHDFAWFADKRFLIDSDLVELSNGQQVETQVFFLHNRRNYWEKSIEYVKRGLLYYSQYVGAYPYSKITAVQGALSAGGGMEYPMITVISDLSGARSLDQVIVHEIGHNWFYGILGFNERRYPWMDEGINSYYDKRYYAEVYPKKELPLKLPGFIRSIASADLEGLYLQFANNRALNQASNLPSDAFTLNNYLLSTYENPARSVKYLASYLGLEDFDRLMQSFYTKWAFKHPGPEDLRNHFENQTGKDLSWFFDGLIGDVRSFDYGIRSVQPSENGFLAEIENKTPYSIPFQIAAMQNDRIITIRWVEGFIGHRSIQIDGTNADRILIDPYGTYPDPNPGDNAIRTKGLLKKLKPLAIQLMGVVRNPDRTQIGWLPSVGWNESNGIMVGLLFHNYTIPNQSFQYLFHPMFSFNTSEPAGQGRLSYDWFQNKTLRNIRLFCGFKSFQYNYPNSGPHRYLKLEPGIRLNFNHNLADRKYNELSFRTSLIRKIEKNQGENANNIRSSLFNRLSLAHQNHTIMSPFNWSMELESGHFDNGFNDLEHYLKTTGEIRTHWLYALHKKIEVRLFGGLFLWKSIPKSTITKPGTLSLIGYARNDYLFDDYFFNRGTQEGFWSRQINMTGGGFKNAVNTAYGLGQSNNYMAAINIKADLPFNLPILNSVKPWFDAGLYSYLPTLSDEPQNKIIYSGGLMIDSYEGMLNIYLPLFNSKVINDIYAEDKRFFDRLSFSMNIKLADLTRLLEREDLLFSQ